MYNWAYGLVSLDMTRLAFPTSQDKYSLTPNVKSFGTQLRMLSAWEAVFISGMWGAFRSTADKLSSVVDREIKFYLFAIYLTTLSERQRCAETQRECWKQFGIRTNEVTSGHIHGRTKENHAKRISKKPVWRSRFAMDRSVTSLVYSPGQAVLISIFVKFINLWFRNRFWYRSFLTLHSLET